MNTTLEDPMQSETQAAELAKQLSAEATVRANEPLARRTTLRVGGPADLYVEPASEADLAAVLRFCAGHERPFFVLGRGSNLLVRDGGYRGVVLCLAHPFFSRIEFAGDRVQCGAGAKLKTLAVEARRNRLAGFEFLEGIPGSVGGGLRMNAGAMSSAMFDVVESVRLMDFNGNARDWRPPELSVEYRACSTLKNHIAISAVLRGKEDSRESIAQRMIAFSRKRWDTQPAAPSAGCIFKNPATIPAGRLIDELGLKGTRVGGAVVSAEHGNFIVNDGTATARDVLELIEVLKQRARVERGIELRTEVEIIGVDAE
jgi:UDP-N-acetylenolpyruvoylglucosamine reductase